jgi:hypothetical protein
LADLPDDHSIFNFIVRKKACKNDDAVRAFDQLRKRIIIAGCGDLRHHRQLRIDQG